MQHQQQRDGRSAHRKIPREPTIEMPMRVIAFGSFGRCRKGRNSSPERACRTRKTSASIGRSRRGRNLPQAMTAQASGPPGDLGHAPSRQTVSDVMSAASHQNRVLAGHPRQSIRNRRTFVFDGILRQSICLEGRSTRSVLACRGDAWFHGFDPEVEVSGSVRRGRSRVGGIRY